MESQSSWQSVMYLLCYNDKLLLLFRPMHAFLCLYVVLFVRPSIVYGDEHIMFICQYTLKSETMNVLLYSILYTVQNDVGKLQ